MKKIRQYRFYGDGNEENYPNNVSKDTLEAGSAFWSENELKNAYISSFGIQTIPGTKFHINGTIDPVLVGTTGIYEIGLNATDNYIISTLSFDRDSLELIETIPGAYLIVDVIFEVEG